MQLLKEEINRRTTSLGSTPTGADWCVKALHPSDPLTEVRGIPDHSAVPSLLMNYQATFKVSPNPQATGTWSFNASLLPHPIQFMYLESTDSYKVNDYYFLNPQISGVTHAEKYVNFAALAQRYRLAYMSVTCYQDGPDLANQGTLVVSQPPVEPRVYYFPYGTSTAPRCLLFTAEDHPDFNTSQSMPNSYFGRSREGAYIPLKLTETCQDWRSARDQITLLSSVTPKPGGVTAFSSAVIMPESYVPAFPLNVYPMSSTAYSPEATSDFLNGTWAQISAQNLSIQTSFSFYVRLGLEMQVSPNSSLAPQLKLSPPHDADALNTYFAVSRELKDAYPADYNCRGRIWDEISKVMKAMAKPLGAALPGAGLLFEGVAGLGDYIKSSRQASKNKSGPAEVQRIRQGLIKAPPGNPRRRRRNKPRRKKPAAAQPKK